MLCLLWLVLAFLRTPSRIDLALHPNPSTRAFHVFFSLSDGSLSFSVTYSQIAIIFISKHSKWQLANMNKSEFSPG